MPAIADDNDRMTFAILRERAEKSAAERDAALAELEGARRDVETLRDTIRALLGCIDGKQFATPEQQDVVWRARRIAS